MDRRYTRREYLYGAGTVGACSALATVPGVAAASCEGTIYTNATEGGDPKLEVPPGEAEITGESTCEPGTELAVQATTSGDPAFVKQAIVTVSGSGGFSATFDFGGIDPGTSFTTTLKRDGETLDTVSNCEVVENAPTPVPTPTPTPSPTPTPTPTATPPPSPTPTATSSPTATRTPGATDTQTSAATTAPRTTTAGDDGSPGGETATETTAPGFGGGVAVAALLVAAWRRARRV